MIHISPKVAGSGMFVLMSEAPCFVFVWFSLLGHSTHSVCMLFVVFGSVPKNGCFWGAVFWSSIFAREGEVTLVGQKRGPENGQCFGDRIWEAAF